VDKPKFGEFLKSVANPGAAEERETEDTSQWAEALEKAAERHFLPQRVKRLEQKLKNQRSNSVSAGSCDLVHLIAAVKALNPKLRGKGSPKKIAVLVDRKLVSLGKRLTDVCPKGWRSTSDLPSPFSEALLHPKLKRWAAVLISKRK